MSNTTKNKTPAKTLRAFPKIKKNEKGEFEVVGNDDFNVKELLGMRTHAAAHGVYVSAISALGNGVEKYNALMSAVFAELEPRDAIEAMLIAQMTATHVATATLIERMSYQNQSDIRESLERSVTRLSRTYLAQMDALKKHRSKAQQTVRVERVTVNEGGQAIVGDVSHKGEGCA